MHTLDELIDRMKERSGCCYSQTHLKCELSEKYKNRIVFADVCGCKNVICFRNMCSYVLSDKWYNDRKENANDDTQRIITSAGKLIANEIR